MPSGVYEHKKGRHWLLSEESKRNMGKSHKNKLFSKKHRDNISKSLMGRKRSKRERQNISKGLTGRELSEEHKQNISKGNIDRELSKEHKQNISKGEIRRFGKMTKEQRLRYMSLAIKASQQARYLSIEKLTWNSKLRLAIKPKWFILVFILLIFIFCLKVRG